MHSAFGVDHGHEEFEVSKIGLAGIRSSEQFTRGAAAVSRGVNAVGRGIAGAGSRMQAQGMKNYGNMLRQSRGMPGQQRQQFKMGARAGASMLTKPGGALKRLGNTMAQPRTF